jgi:hypothetical protein
MNAVGGYVSRSLVSEYCRTSYAAREARLWQGGLQGLVRPVHEVTDFACARETPISLTPPPPCTLVLVPCACWALWTMPTPRFPPAILFPHLPPVRCCLARCWVHMEASAYGRCCPGGGGEAAEERAGRWRRRKETEALRAEGVWLGVWGEVVCSEREVGAAGEGVVQVERQWAGREEGGESLIGVQRTGRSFACRGRRRTVCGGVRSVGMPAASVPMPVCTWRRSILPPLFALTAARTAPSDSCTRANCGNTGW